MARALFTPEELAEIAAADAQMEGRAAHGQGARYEYCHQYYEKNKERIKARSIEWAKANREKANAIHRAYYARNKERLIQKSAEWAKANRERRNASSRAYYRRKREAMLNGEGKS